MFNLYRTVCKQTVEEDLDQTQHSAASDCGQHDLPTFMSHKKALGLNGVTEKVACGVRLRVCTTCKMYGRLAIHKGLDGFWHLLFIKNLDHYSSH